MEPATTAEFKTRALVYRPIAPEDFSGTVIVEWLNVSAGLDSAPDWISLHTEIFREGHACVGVSAQIAGIEGREGGNIGPVPPYLKGWNLERYGQRGDSFCRLFGTTERFNDGQLAALYPTEADYVAAVRSSCKAAVAAGFLLRPDADLIIEAAETFGFGNFGDP